MTSERSIPHLRDIFGLGTQPYQQTSYEADVHTKQFPEFEPKTKKQSKKSKGKDGDYISTGDVKTLERHLSMKKTIRKKIMRDLRQAFVEDPNEFKVEDTTPAEKLKAELSAEAVIIEKNHRRTTNEPTFLDMLRGDASRKQDDVARNSTNSHDRNIDNDNTIDKPGFWRRLTMKNKVKR